MNGLDRLEALKAFYRATRPPTLYGAGCTYNRPVAVKRLGLAWTYDWSCNPTLYEDVESVPMLWGADHVGKPLGGNSDWLMGFNEPDQESQSDLSPERAARLWCEVEHLYPERKLVSPAPLSYAWLTDWYNAYCRLYDRRPRVDAVAGHVYEDRPWKDAYRHSQQHARELSWWARDRSIREVWITEFAHFPGWGGTHRYAQKMALFYQRHWRVRRYAWFQVTFQGDEPWWGFGPANNTSLVDWETMRLTQIGVWYRNGGG